MMVNPPGWINRTLTEEEKTTMLKEGKCFRCGNKGHMSKACVTIPRVDCSYVFLFSMLTNPSPRRLPSPRMTPVDDM